jgi:hypothetical protein
LFWENNHGLTTASLEKAMKRVGLALAGIVAALLSLSVFAQAQLPLGDRRLLSPDEPKLVSRRPELWRAPRVNKRGPLQVTLFARSTYGAAGYGSAAFNFNGVRSDARAWRQVFRNKPHLVYGNAVLGGDHDYFEVAFGWEQINRIKDLGELEWSEVGNTPQLLLANQQSRPYRVPHRGESYESASGGRGTKVVVGHMYLEHYKDEQEEFYAMFRVETLEPNNKCTISWKVVPSPKKR